MERSRTLVILGHCPAKSNNYIPIARGKMVKNNILRQYEKGFMYQGNAQWKGDMITTPFKAEMYCYFRTNASDLDNAWKIVLDCFQKMGIIKNDNLLYYQIGHKFIDSKNPRVEIEITTLD